MINNRWPRRHCCFCCCCCARALPVSQSSGVPCTQDSELSNALSQDKSLQYGFNAFWHLAAVFWSCPIDVLQILVIQIHQITLLIVQGGQGGQYTYSERTKPLEYLLIKWGEILSNRKYELRSKTRPIILPTQMSSICCKTQCLTNANVVFKSTRKFELMKMAEQSTTNQLNCQRSYHHPLQIPLYDKCKSPALKCDFKVN